MGEKSLNESWHTVVLSPCIDGLSTDLHEAIDKIKIRNITPRIVFFVILTPFYLEPSDFTCLSPVVMGFAFLGLLFIALYRHDLISNRGLD
jgi:hypothetical protein